VAETWMTCENLESAENFRLDAVRHLSACANEQGFPDLEYVFFSRRR
jgi:hypothetical protein